MKLWLLRPINPDGGPWEPWYNKAFGFVIRARTELEARLLTKDATGDEAHEVNPWLDSTLSICIELTKSGDAGVIIRDFAAAYCKIIEASSAD